MKKFLSILAAVGLTATTASSVVACGSSSKSDEKHKMYDKINFADKDQVILKYGNSELRAEDLPLLTDSTKQKEIILDWINTGSTTRYTNDVLNKTKVSKLQLADGNITNKLNNGKYVGSTDDKSLDPTNIDSTNNYFNQEVNGVGNNITIEKLYTDYVASISGTKTPLDNSSPYADKINPDSFKTIEGEREDGMSNLSIWYSSKEGDKTGYKRWAVANDFKNNLHITKGDPAYLNLFSNVNIPTADELTGGKTEFFVVRGATNDIKSNADLFSEGKLPNDVLNEGEALTGKEALSLRFQNYIATSQQNTEKIMAIQYLKGDMYRVRSNGGTDKELISRLGDNALEKEGGKSLFFNKDSLFAKDIQSWTSNNYQSNYKMVWSFAVPKEKIPAVNTLLNGYWINSNGGQKDGSYLLNINNISDVNTIAGIFENLVKTAGDNQSVSGVDSIFNRSGYQGIVKKDGETNVKSVLGGSLNIDERAKAGLASVDGPSVLINKDSINTTGAKDFTFENKDLDATKYADVIISVPLFLQDLFATDTYTQNSQNPALVDAGANNISNLALDKWVELKPQNKEAGWTETSAITSAGGFKKVEFNTLVAEPTEPTITTVNGVNYVFVPKDKGDTPHASINLTLDNKTVNFTWAKVDNKNYLGANGIFSGTEASSLNGRDVNYKLHLGSDNSNPDVLENEWKTNRSQNVKEITQLSDDKKQLLLDYLLFLTVDNDSQAVENAKNGIYQRYINPNDIWYQPIYDAIIKYIKVNNEDESSD
ncbi:lipoprotein [Mesoplasma lactucae]|uniref:Uncharacterized protein n=1 Tax=Mesoplasma lactucae ATCC 49193 TaxID=81460 RepID=A0A291IS35_9MOLU|nr:lipoprotein [Mesoplasma lactucae]ATG97516.1 hypothetical protein CP520_01980 [Mesoplasma lactucae ATCC 49193]ATZ20028.1 hypothetical protein MLACT_v1c02060 [Mesoplasma lactucae ATCC 49193]MCL8217021.1 hypothetical protein [Mesoplasma lactucae ATCC 49193]